MTLIQVFRAAREKPFLSPWEQGLDVADEIDWADGAEPFVSFDEASSAMGFDTPAIKVGSAEANLPAQSQIDEVIMASLRTLIARGLFEGDA